MKKYILATFVIIAIVLFGFTGWAITSFFNQENTNRTAYQQSSSKNSDQGVSSSVDNKIPKSDEPQLLNSSGLVRKVLQKENSKSPGSFCYVPNVVAYYETNDLDSPKIYMLPKEQNFYLTEENNSGSNFKRNPFEGFQAVNNLIDTEGDNFDIAQNGLLKNAIQGFECPDPNAEALRKITGFSFAGADKSTVVITKKGDKVCEGWSVDIFGVKKDYAFWIPSRLGTSQDTVDKFDAVSKKCIDDINNDKTQNMSVYLDEVLANSEVKADILKGVQADAQKFALK